MSSSVADGKAFRYKQASYGNSGTADTPQEIYLRRKRKRQEHRSDEEDWHRPWKASSNFAC
ncbi:hypothetical protein A9986_06375 [Solibacillus silvestris]|nr:hypothetical protein A9986_06375 [Solibacillus silvestris]